MNPSTAKNDVTREDLSRYLRLAKSAAIEAGKLLVDKLGKVDVQEKNPGDFVTQADIAAQALIHQMIMSQCPDHSFLGEEDEDHSAERHSEFCWIVDPLDGTTNFIHALRSFSVSIALQYRKEMIVGCVYDPLLDEMYAASIGGGATLNDQPIAASGAISNKGALICVSLPSGVDRDSPAIKRLVNVLCNSPATVRRLGSTALNLCFVACGRLDAYWSTSAKIWDVAAGILIMQEAGGIIVAVDGSPFEISKIKFVAASTTAMADELISYMDIE